MTRVTFVEKEEKVLGTSKVGPKNRITLVKNVQEKLQIKEGDLVVYLENEKGNVVIRASKFK